MRTDQIEAKHGNPTTGLEVGRGHANMVNQLTGAPPFSLALMNSPVSNQKKTGQLPASLGLQEVQLKIRESYTNPNVGKVSQVVLKDGPKTFKIATIFEIVNPNTGDFHHHHLRLDHIEKKIGGWFARPERSFQIESNEIEALTTFLVSLASGSLEGQVGDLHIIRTEDYQQLAAVVESLEDLPAHDRIELVAAILAKFDNRGAGVDEFLRAFAQADLDVLSAIASASRLAEYERAYEFFLELLEDSTATEQAFQAHLAEHPWMFGSEYSELLDRRGWTRDDRLDFMLRRTTDGYLEIVEIKTPSVGALLRYDDSHDSYYPSSQLSRVLGQVVRYVEEIERQRDTIIAKDREDPLRIRARVIIGRDGMKGEQSALRAFNSHLHRLEILTFDDLCRTANRVLNIFRSLRNHSDQANEDPPF